MWLKFLLWLGTKKGQWVLRIFAFLIAGVVQYAYTAHAEKRAYNNGYLVAKAEYVEATKTQSTQLTAQLNDTFKKHQELLNQWISDTISKYNRCVTAKDAVTEAYQLIYKEVNNEKP